jgi:AraC family transcriptional regulator of adaptative response/methylated-DNA-[protein]-cysteine methyltransferase
MVARSTFADDETRWSAVTHRDPAADGRFYYAVLTTGRYSRPSCASRLARRQNVRFFPTGAAAARAGFRPCGRCRPEEVPLDRQYADAVAAACRLVQSSPTVPTLDELADAAGFSRFHFHRMFKAVTGVTPHSYVMAHRAERVRDELFRAESVTDAIYRSGFQSNGNFYAASNEVLGMTPSRFRAGGRGAVIRVAVGGSAADSVLVAATDKGVCGVLVGGDPRRLRSELRARFPRAELVGDSDFDALVDHAVDTTTPSDDLPVDLRRSALHHGVWQTLRDETAA